MINIPTEVKDALQKGSYKKNYKMSVLEIPSTPEDYYEIARIVQNQKYEIPSNGSYKIVGNAASSFSGVTTWVGGEEAEWFEPQVVNPTTEYDSYYNAGEIISVAGFVDIQYVSVMKWFEEKSGKEGFIIDNNNLVSESVSIDERMCSDKYLKFGLCEGSSLEFQYFGYPNITGRQVQALLDVEYEHIVQDEPVYYDTIDQHDIPYTFVDAHTYQLKITEGNDIIILVKVLDAQGNIIDTCEVPQMGQRTMEVTVPVGARIVVEKPYDPEEALYVTIEMTYTTSEPVKTLEWYTIPMGYFTVDKCAKQMNTGIFKATCYNKLMSDYLDAEANSLLLSNCGNADLPLSIYDIQTMLLADYQITQTSEVDTQVADHLYTTGTNGLATKLTSNTSDATPINYYNVFRSGGYAWNTTFYLCPFPHGWRWTADPTKYYTIRVDIDVAKWEKNFIDYVSALIDNSLLNKTSSEFLNWIANTSTGGWENMMAVEIKYNDNTSQIYSDAAYARGVATGTFKDIINKTITNATEIIWWQCTLLYLGMTASAGNVYGSLQYDGANYTYSKQSGTGTYRTFKFPNGEDMPVYGEHGSVEPVPYWFHCYELQGLTEADKITMVPTQMPDFTLREIISANYETVCQYGQLDRETDLFSGVELNPDMSPAILRDNYSKLWYDEGRVEKFRYLIITYKGLDGQGNETDYTLQRTINADGTQNYNMSDNWLFRNLVWDAATVGQYADAMVAKMQDIEWMPFELWCAGLPYIEVGDYVWIQNKDGADPYWTKSYVLQRTLKGIQNLEDTYIDGELDVF